MRHEPPTEPDSALDDRVSAHYLGERGARYAASVQAKRSLVGVLEKDKFAAFVRPTDTVLDFGCSSGELLRALDADERIGVEVNPTTRGEAIRAGVRVFDSLRSVAKQSVDVAISNHVLEHVVSPYAALRQLKRVLRPSGRLVICVPADDWRNAPRWRPDDHDHHVFAWTPLTLGNLLTEAGFDPVFVRIRQRAWPPGYERLHQLPGPVWDAVCLVWSIARRRREILALAKPGPDVAPERGDAVQAAKTGSAQLTAPPTASRAMRMGDERRPM